LQTFALFALFAPQALVINMIAGLFLGQIGYYVAMVYTGCMMAYFMVRSPHAWILF
jgi:hypothetical protein